MPSRFYKQQEGGIIWWAATSDREGVFEFSFDKVTIFNLFADYPWKLTEEQKAIFDKENPFWADFFKDRV